MGQPFAQTHEIDSLSNLLKTEKADTNKVNHFNDLASALSQIKPDSTLILADQAAHLATSLNYVLGEAEAYQNEGTAYRLKGDYSKSLELELKALEIAEKTGAKKLRARVLNSMGLIYWSQGNYPQAIDYDIKALKIEEENGNKNGIASNLNNLGLVYWDIGDYAKALDYYKRALVIDKENKDNDGIAADYCNMGNIYFDQAGTILQASNKNDSLYKKALDCYQKSLSIAKITGDKQWQAYNLGNIGSAFIHLGDDTKALDYYQQSMKMDEEMGEKSGLAISLGNIGNLYTKNGKYSEAEDYLNRAITLENTLGEKQYLKLFEEYISHLYDTTKRYKLSLEWFKKAMILKDTLFNVDKNKAVTRKEMTYEFEKKEAIQKAEQDKKDALAEADKRRQRIVIWSVCGGLLLALVFAAFIFRSLRITSRQKNLIEKQKDKVEEQKNFIEHQKALVEEQKQLVEEKNKDIVDSINYAKRLQDAILPPVNLIKTYLPESFVLYKPKDIVAGDFYWMWSEATYRNIAGEEVDQTILIAAADCTGHGVPGALVSVVCSNALNRTVKEFKITEPGNILDKTRDLVLETFEKSESNVQDGMDISLVSIRHQQKANSYEIKWAGAFNSLWYVEKGEIKELAADKQPIGKTDNPLPFTTHNITLQKGDSLYLFTDGYADQFGGPKGKKFKYKQLEQLILNNSQFAMEEQKQNLEQTLDNWKGNLEQVDDILIIGIRV